MRKTSESILIEAACRARERAVAPYSRFKVGAALLTAGGAIVTGVNVESSSYGLTRCAEWVALFKALTEGEPAFVATPSLPVSPAGRCPAAPAGSSLAEYVPDASVLVVDSSKPRIARRFSVRTLLPESFGLAVKKCD